MSVSEPADRSFTVTWPSNVTWHDGFHMAHAYGVKADGVTDDTAAIQAMNNAISAGSTSNGIQVWDFNNGDMQQQANQIAAQLNTVQFTSAPPSTSSYTSGTKTLRELVERIDGHDRPADYILRACELLGQILERREADERAEQLARRSKTAPLRQRRVMPPTER